MRDATALLVCIGLLSLACVGQAAAGAVPPTAGERSVPDTCGSAATDAPTTATTGASPEGSATDSDGDGLADELERETFGTDPNEADTDGDGLDDGEEVHQYGTNPNRRDTDGDGLDDGEEIREYGTDPTNVDTDDDGVDDAAEVRAGTDSTGETRTTAGPGETGTQGATSDDLLPVLTFAGGVVFAFALAKAVRFYRSYRDPLVVKLDDDKS